MQYVLGFYVTRGGVLLIRKRRPAWQKGLLNGVGGKVEPGESAIEAMVREFEEETGLPTVPEDWHKFALLRCEDAEEPWEVTCYRSFGDQEPAPERFAASGEDESVEFLPLGERTSLEDKANAISNLQWLIPMALDRDTRRGLAVIPYQDFER